MAGKGPEYEETSATPASSKTSKTVAETPSDLKQKKPILGWFVGLAVVAGAVVAFLMMQGGDDAPETSLSAEQIFAMQTACFDGGLFYDENGACYTIDPRTLTADELVLYRVAAPAATTTTTTVALAAGGSTTTVAGQPVAPGGGSTTTSTTVGQAAPTTTAGATTTTTAGATTTTTTAAATTTTTAGTTTTTFGGTIASGEWRIKLFATKPEGQTCVDSGTTTTTLSPECAAWASTLSGFSATIAVTGGTVSGNTSGSQSGLGQPVSFSGTIGSNFAVSMSATAGNMGSFSFTGTLTGDNKITGSYTHTSATNPPKVTTGSFTATR